MQILLPHINLSFCMCEESNNKQDYLLVAGGKQPDNQLLNQLSNNKIVCCADKGISYCRQANILPDYLFGDNDSSSNEDWYWANKNGVKTKKYSKYKDKTDLQLTLEHILKADACKSLVVTGIWGGRFDHLYGAVFTISAYSKLLNCPVILIDQDEVMCIINEGQNVKLDFLLLPQTISLLPLEQQVNVTMTGCKWELEKSTLTQYDPYAISNVLKENSKSIEVIIHKGQVGLYTCFLSI